MNRTELFDLIRNGENSTLEFKRDDIQNHVRTCAARWFR